MFRLNGTCSHVGVILWGIVNLSEETCTMTMQRWHNKKPGKHPVHILTDLLINL